MVGGWWILEGGVHLQSSMMSLNWMQTYTRLDPVDVNLKVCNVGKVLHQQKIISLITFDISLKSESVLRWMRRRLRVCY